MRRSPLFAFLLLPAPILGQSADEKKATVEFLIALQQPDGGFVAAPLDRRVDTAPKSSLRATSAAVRAIRYMGGEVPNKEKTLAFVKSCRNNVIGAFADAPGGRTEFAATSVGMMAIAELTPGASQEKSIQYLATKARLFEDRRLAVAGMEAAGTFPREVQEWIAEVNKGRNPDGTYGKGAGQARETGGVVAMILRSGGKLPDDQRKAVVNALRAGQRSDGGFGKEGAEGSDAETTYRVMRAFHLLKDMPKDVPRLNGFLAKCRNADGGYGTAPGQSSTVSGTYYAAAVSHWLEK